MPYEIEAGGRHEAGYEGGAGRDAGKRTRSERLARRANAGAAVAGGAEGSVERAAGSSGAPLRDDLRLDLGGELRYGLLIELGSVHEDLHGQAVTGTQRGYLAHELGPQGIRVHPISPGPLKTRAASGLKIGRAHV